MVLLVLHESGLATHASLRQLDARQPPQCLAISPDNAYVVVGLGPQVLLLHYSDFQLQWAATIRVPSFADPASIKFQTCNFSPDGSSLVVATQRSDPRRSQDDDAVYTYVWPCQPFPGNPTRLWIAKMPTVSRPVSLPPSGPKRSSASSATPTPPCAGPSS